MKISLLLGVLMAVSGLPTQQDLYGDYRGDSYIGDSYGGQPNQVEKQVGGGYEKETEYTNDVGSAIDTSEKLENDGNLILADVSSGYDEENEKVECYTNKDASKKLEDDNEDDGSGYDDNIAEGTNGLYDDNSTETRHTSKSNVEDSSKGYDDEIPLQNNSYVTKDESEKLEDSLEEGIGYNEEMSHLGNGYDEATTQKNNGYDEDISNSKKKNIHEDISKKNNIHHNNDDSENLEGIVQDLSGYDQEDNTEKPEQNIEEDNVSDHDEEKMTPKINENNLPSDSNEPDNEDLEEAVTIESNPSLSSCSSFTEEFGYTCVPYYQCSNGTIITDGTGLIDIRNGFGALDAQDSKCPDILDVCCKDPDFVAPPPKPQPYQASCGRRNKEGLGARILGFKEGESQVGEWPHMCALLKEETNEEETPEGYEGGEEKSSTVHHFICGASLIAPGAVLTGAHCVDKVTENDNFKVRCGEWDTNTEDEPYQHQDRYIANYVVHPGFKSTSLHNDVAVLFTTADFVLDHNIDTICLPEPGETFDNEDCFATGWGKNQFGGQGQYQAILKEVDLPVVDFRQCEASLRQTRLGAKFNLHQSFLCAGGEPGKDTCKGDGGSPLVCPSKHNPETYVQAGIVAWGIGCGEATPGVYADVSQASCFIDHAMSCHGVGAGGSAGSHWQYHKGQCGDWMMNMVEDEVAEIPKGTPQRILAAVKQHIQGKWEKWAQSSCTVDYVDIGKMFARQQVKSEQNGNSY